MIEHSFSYGDLEVYLLIVVRLMTFIYVCPFFGGRQTPNLVKIGYGLLISILLFVLADGWSLIIGNLVKSFY
jgi:flagellar biosynthetic protein FliR